MAEISKTWYAIHFEYQQDRQRKDVQPSTETRSRNHCCRGKAVRVCSLNTKYNYQSKQNKNYCIIVMPICEGG